MCLATCDVSMRMLHLVVVLVDLDMSMKVVHCSVAGSLMTSIAYWLYIDGLSLCFLDE